MKHASTGPRDFREKSAANIPRADRRTGSTRNTGRENSAEVGEPRSVGRTRLSSCSRPGSCILVCRTAREQGRQDPDSLPLQPEHKQAGGKKVRKKGPCLNGTPQPSTVISSLEGGPVGKLHLKSRSPAGAAGTDSPPLQSARLRTGGRKHKSCSPAGAAGTDFASHQSRRPGTGGKPARMSCSPTGAAGTDFSPPQSQHTGGKTNRRLCSPAGAGWHQLSTASVRRTADKRQIRAGVV